MGGEGREARETGECGGAEGSLSAREALSGALGLGCGELELAGDAMELAGDAKGRPSNGVRAYTEIYESGPLCLCRYHPHTPAPSKGHLQGCP